MSQQLEWEGRRTVPHLVGDERSPGGLKIGRLRRRGPRLWTSKCRCYYRFTTRMLDGDDSFGKPGCLTPVGTGLCESDPIVSDKYDNIVILHTNIRGVLSHVVEFEGNL